jgi:hypothetical protein
MRLRTQKCEARVVAHDGVTVAEVREDALCQGGRELEGRKGFVEIEG